MSLHNFFFFFFFTFFSQSWFRHEDNFSISFKSKQTFLKPVRTSHGTVLMWRGKGCVYVVRVNREVIRLEHSWLSWVESLTPYCSWLKYQEQPGKKSMYYCQWKIRYSTHPLPRHFVLLPKAGITLNLLCGSTAG